MHATLTSFTEIRQLVQDRFQRLLSLGTLYNVEVDRDKIWEIYLSNIPEEFRQSNNCNCCKSFLRQFAGIVAINNVDNERLTMWDVEDDSEEYGAALKAVRRYILSLPITGIFLHSTSKLGTEQNRDTKRNTTWSHFYVQIPNQFVKHEDKIPSLIGTSRDDKEVFQRALTEITTDAVDTVLELMATDSLYRGDDHKVSVLSLQKLQKDFKKVPEHLRSNFCWVQASKLGSAFCRVRNTVIGTLLTDLSEGKELERAVASYEAKVAPTNYKRPTALATPKMIEAAKTRLTDLGLLGCLHRRMLSDVDLNVGNALWVDRPKPKSGDVFEALKENVSVNPKTLKKVEEISIDDFLANVLPTTNSMRVLLENGHLPNFVSLIGPGNREEDAPTMFRYGNNFSFSYAGGLADSIKERVKDAGGSVTGTLRVSLAWGNHDDLDLHVYGPGEEHIYYGTRGTLSRSGGTLDVDMNAGMGTTRTPVENITWKNRPSTVGTYRIVVHNFSRREVDGTGYEVEIEFEGQTFHFSAPTNPQSKGSHEIATFTVSKSEGFKLNKEGTIGNYASKEKWNLTTGQFHKVRAITRSPNFWEGATQNGLRHTFFFLEGCKSDEKPRGFLNEFLKQELDQDRKVFEMLSSKVEVDPVENELSGIGFADTVRNHVFVEVEGKIKRTLKVKF